MGTPVPDELRQYFEKHEQHHVFRFLDGGKCSEDEVNNLVDQLQKIELTKVAEIFKHSEDSVAGGDEELQPPEDKSVAKFGSEEFEKGAAEWEKKGMEAIRRGEVAACVLAGGQASRLGLDGPKGMFDVGLPSSKTLFQLFAERILKLKQLGAGEGGTPARLPFLVMTSPLNHAKITEYFSSNKYFGLPEEEMIFFPQGTLPCLTSSGKLILESRGCLAQNPDGNGGIYPALERNGVLEKLTKLGVQAVHIFSVDNLTVRPADPLFVGFCQAMGAEAGNKSVWKAYPEEKIGVMARRGEKNVVVEYSELDETRKNMKDAKGKLLFGAGNICNHFFSVAFLKDTVCPKWSHQTHVAKKKIPYADPETGDTVKPSENNGVKMEGFIFDSFPLAGPGKLAILEVGRDEFAPVKNPPTEKNDTPDTARKILSDLHRKWVEAAGGTVSGPEDAVVEVSPLLSYSGEGLETACKGKTFTAPCEVKPSNEKL